MSNTIKSYLMITAGTGLHKNIASTLLKMIVFTSSSSMPSLIAIDNI